MASQQKSLDILLRLFDITNFRYKTAGRFIKRIPKRRIPNSHSIGLAINVFENTEFIERIVKELRDCVQFIIVGYNDIHYNGNIKAPPRVLTYLNQLKEQGLIDEILLINLSEYCYNTTLAECAKRNIMAEAIENKGCTYQLVIDSDELFLHDDFVAMFNYIQQHHIQCSYVSTINYYHDTNHYITQDKPLYINFIALSFFRFKYQCWGGFNVDATRQYYVNTKDIITLPIEYKCHHLSYVIDIKTKLTYYSQQANISPEQRKQIEDSYNNFQDDTKLVYGTAGQPMNITKTTENCLC